jgi:hypothetical protein
MGRSARKTSATFVLVAVAITPTLAES